MLNQLLRRLGGRLPPLLGSSTWKRISPLKVPLVKGGFAMRLCGRVATQLNGDGVESILWGSSRLLAAYTIPLVLKVEYISPWFPSATSPLLTGSLVSSQKNTPPSMPAFLLLPFIILFPGGAIPDPFRNLDLTDCPPACRYGLLTIS